MPTILPPASCPRGSSSSTPNRTETMTISIAVSSQKGGVGKTTSVANLAAAWGSAGRRVLAVDFDPQFGLTRALGQKPSNAGATVDQLVSGHATLTQALSSTRQVVPGVDLLASRRELADLEITLVTQLRREEFLARALSEDADKFDVVLIDCPPNLGLLTVNALFAARHVLAPIDMTDDGALQGAAEITAIVQRIAASGGEPAMAALALTKADPRRVSYQAIRSALAHIAVPVAASEIPLRADFTNARLHGKPLLTWAPDSLGAHAYRALAAELSTLLDTPPLRIVA